MDGNSTMSPPRVWASLQDAAIRPGVQVISSVGQCTSNFVYTSPDNATVYLGFAAHCITPSTAPAGTATNGCDSRNTPLPPGTKVEVEGAADEGVVAYSSWWTMRQTQETDAVVCAENDFALVRLSATDAMATNPAMLHFGGPTGIAAPDSLLVNDKVLTYGNSGLRLGVEDLRRKEGYIYDVTEWTTIIVTVTPGIQGDSGSGVILESGPAIGAAVTSYAVPPGGSGVTNLAPALAYAKEMANLDVRLATWDVLDAGSLPPI